MSAPPDPTTVAAPDSGFTAVDMTGHESEDDDTPTDQLPPRRQQSTSIGENRAVPGSGCVLRSRYVLEEVIGRGGTSIIYRARDLHRAVPRDTAANLVAVKMLRAEQCEDPLALMRLRREFQHMQCLSHPGIVRVFDLDCDDDVWFMSMELVAGRTVKSWMETGGSRADAMRIIAACCEALEYAHAQGILHADLKSTNVMVADDGTVKLIDFGSTPNPGGETAAASDSIFSVTPLYASPQVLAGKSVERRDDIFSLACLSYSILSGGRHPFGGRPSLEDGRAKLAPTYVRSIPAGIFAVIERGLSAERERRQATVGEFLRELMAADRRCRADATSEATSAADDFGLGLRPEWPLQAAAGLSHSMLPVLIKGFHSGSRSWRLGDSFSRAQSSYLRALPLVRLTATVFAIVVAGVVFRLGTQPDAIQAAGLPPKVSVTPPEPTAAPAKTASVPETGGSPPDSGSISFDAPTVRASAVQPLVAITVKRLPLTKSRGAFLWQVERGTAYPGIDYQRIEPQLVRFSEGQTARTLFIPLLTSHATLLPRGPRTFTVALKQLAGGPALGRFSRVKVEIDPAPGSGNFAYQARAAE